MEDYIKEFNGQIIGVIRTEPNGDKIAFEFPSRKILGFYKKNMDITTDLLGRPVSRGDTVVSLIYRKDI